MVHIYTFCDKTLVGRCENLSAKFLCENLYKLNFKIENVSVFCNKYDYQSLTFKDKDIYFLLMQKTSNVLNSYLSSLVSNEIVENNTLKQVVSNYFKQINIPLDKTAEFEWLIPSSAVAITNPNGKTQGYLIKIANSEIFVLPNEVNELKQMFNDCVLDYLEKNYPIVHKTETFKIFGLSINHIKMILDNEIKNKDNVSITFFANGLNNDIVIKSKIDNPKFDEYVRVVFAKLEKYIYSVNGLSMIEKLEQELLSQNIKLSYASDFSAIDLLKGCSLNINNRLGLCVILTNNKSITEFLNKEVNEISAETTYEIAVKLLEKSDCDISFVSLYVQNDNVWQSFMAVGNKIKIDIYKNKFSGEEKEVLNNINQTARFYLLKRLMIKDLKTI